MKILLQAAATTLLVVQTVYAVKMCKNLKIIQPKEGKKTLSKIIVLEAAKIIISIVSYCLDMRIRALRTTFPILLFSVAMYIKFSNTEKSS